MPQGEMRHIRALLALVVWSAVCAVAVLGKATPLKEAPHSGTSLAQPNREVKTKSSCAVEILDHRPDNIVRVSRMEIGQGEECQVKFKSMAGFAKYVESLDKHVDQLSMVQIEMRVKGAVGLRLKNGEGPTKLEQLFRVSKLDASPVTASVTASQSEATQLIQTALHDIPYIDDSPESGHSPGSATTKTSASTSASTSQAQLHNSIKTSASTSQAQLHNSIKTSASTTALTRASTSSATQLHQQAHQQVIPLDTDRSSGSARSSTTAFNSLLEGPPVQFQLNKGNGRSEDDSRKDITHLSEDKDVAEWLAYRVPNLCQVTILDHDWSELVTVSKLKIGHKEKCSTKFNTMASFAEYVEKFRGMSEKFKRVQVFVRENVQHTHFITTPVDYSDYLIHPSLVLQKSVDRPKFEELRGLAELDALPYDSDVGQWGDDSRHVDWEVLFMLDGASFYDNMSTWSPVFLPSRSKSKKNAKKDKVRRKFQEEFENFLSSVPHIVLPIFNVLIDIKSLDWQPRRFPPAGVRNLYLKFFVERYFFQLIVNEFSVETNGGVKTILQTVLECHIVRRRPSVKSATYSVKAATYPGNSATYPVKSVTPGKSSTNPENVTAKSATQTKKTVTHSAVITLDNIEPVFSEFLATTPMRRSVGRSAVRSAVRKGRTISRPVVVLVHLERNTVDVWMDHRAARRVSK